MPSTFVSTEIQDTPGTLAEASRCLAKGNVNVEGFCVAGGRGFFLTSNPTEAERCFEEAGLEYNTTEAFELRVANKPGELAHVCESLAKQDINIDCCYGSAAGQGGTIFIAVDNPSAARPILSKLSTAPKQTAPVSIR